MRKKLWVVIILSSFLLFHFVNNFFWLKKDNYIYGSDSGWHFIEAVKYHEACKTTLLSQASFFVKTEQLIQIFRNWQANPNWPPLIYFLSALISPHEIHTFGPRLYMNFVFFVLLVLSTYFLGTKCFNRKVGLIAAFLISFYPAVGAYSRAFGLDFPLLCVTAACVCLLVHSENFSKRGYSLLFGLSLGMGTLVKLQIMFFLLMPLLYAILGISRKKNSEKLNGFSNLILSCAIAFSLFYLYWGNKMGGMLESFLGHAFAFYSFSPAENPPVTGASIPILSLRNFTLYLESLLFHTSFFPFILFISALVVFLFSKNKWRIFFLLSLLIAYLIISFIPVKWNRYALPLLPFMAVISGWFIDSIKLKYFKISILCVLVFYSVSFYFFNSWTLKRFQLVPQPFLSLAANDRAKSNLYPPNSFDYTGELKEGGIIPYIEQKVREGKIVRIKFDGYVDKHIALLYIYFQDAILNDKLTIQRTPMTGFQDADIIVTIDSEFSNKKDQLENYKVLSRIRNNIVFLIKR